MFESPYPTHGCLPHIRVRYCFGLTEWWEVVISEEIRNEFNPRAQANRKLGFYKLRIVGTNY